MLSPPGLAWNAGTSSFLPCRVLARGVCWTLAPAVLIQATIEMKGFKLPSRTKIGHWIPDCGHRIDVSEVLGTGEKAQ